MSEINFTLSKQNFQLVIQHVFIGNWILNSTKIDRDKEIDNLLNTILSIGKNYNIMDGIDYNEDTNEYDLCQEKEQEVMEFIEAYEDENFWEELIDKLATRDAIKKFGVEKLDKMEQYERMKKIWEEEEKYNNEFEEKGIQRLKIVK